MAKTANYLIYFNKFLLIAWARIDNVVWIPKLL